MISIESAMTHGHCLPNNYSPSLLILEKGSGCTVEDIRGNRYLDMGAGIAVNALGYGRSDLAHIAAAQMEKLIHVSNLYATEPELKLAAKLTALGNFAAVHFGNSGSEANEAALKYARLYSLRTKGEGHHRILAFEQSFHGRTMGSLAATATEKYKAPFAPMVPGFEFGEYNNPDRLKSILNDTFAAVIVEPLQGEGGLTTMTDSFADALNELCRRHNILLIADEVQTGLGRTGLPFASAWMGLQPDLITLAKPLAGGLPLSATLIPAKVNDCLHPGEHGTTFGGGPVTCAVADAVLEQVLNPEFLLEVQRKGKYLQEKIEQLAKELPCVVQCTGLGLLRGIQLTGVDPGKAVDAAMREGLLVLRAGTDKIRVAPPLIITEAEIDRGLGIIKQVLIRLTSHVC